MNNTVKAPINSANFKTVGRTDDPPPKRNATNGKLIFVFILIFLSFFGKMKDKRRLYLAFFSAFNVRFGRWNR